MTKNPFEYLFPPKCVCCREILQDENGPLCDTCRAKFEAETQKTCGFCGSPMYECECMPPHLRASECSGLMRVCSYNGHLLSPVTRIVFTLKKKANGRCERFAAEQLADRLRIYLDKYFDCEFAVTCVPRRRRAVILYGHDHGELLARNVAGLCGLDFLKFVKNRGKMKEQKSLDFRGRKRNARYAFSPSSQIEEAKGRNIILIDDVTTSGASLAAVSKILIDAGAASVTCLCFASVVKKKKVGH